MSVSDEMSLCTIEKIKSKNKAIYSGSPVHIAITILSEVGEPVQGSVNNNFRENLRTAKDTALKILMSEMEKYTFTTDNIEGNTDEKFKY